MAVEIREVHVEDYEAVRAVWEASNWDALPALGSVDAWATFLQHHRGLSIGAFEGTDLLGMIISDRTREGAHRQRVALAANVDVEEVSRDLVDKAQLKLGAKRRNSCRIELPASLAPDEFWQSVKWTGHTADNTAPLIESNTCEIDDAENVASTPQSTQPAA